ncbi:MAG TPA: aminodeoxychorismate/anthranilate synthase component II [Ktedonobacterales bacterium]
MILLIDNYDSFTYNLYQYLAELGAEVIVARNDEISLDEVERLAPSRIVLSPGPCTPREAGISNAIIGRFGPRIPLLGVCLGHQCIGAYFGGRVIRAPQAVHGKVAHISHGGHGILRGLPNPFEATRYHSLIVERDTLPDCLEVTAQTADGLIMGLRHREYRIEGVQFHPESILSPKGKALLRNFLEQDQEAWSGLDGMNEPRSRAGEREPSTALHSLIPTGFLDATRADGTRLVARAGRGAGCLA